MNDRGGGGGGEGIFHLSATDDDVLWLPSPEKRISTPPLSPQVEQWFQPSRSTTMHSNQSERSHATTKIPWKQRWKYGIQQRIPNKRIIRRVLKCSLAYFLATLFILIKPVANALGPAPFLCATGMLFSHPGRTVGAQVDTTVMACMGILLSVAYGMGGVAVSAAGHRPYTSILLFCGIFAASALRQQWPRFFFFSLHFMVLQIFILTAIGPSLILPLKYGIPMLIGCGVSLIVNIVVWPESATDNLGRTIQETMQNCRETLVALTEQFFLSPTAEPMDQRSIDQLVEKMRKTVTKMRGAYREAKYEISYTYIRPQELLELRKALERVVNHLGALSGSLRAERQLFGREYDVDAVVKRNRRRTDNRLILYNYLERLRDPLSRLSSECADVLQYLVDEFDEEKQRSLKNDDKRPEQPTIHLQEFDNEEKERICSLHLREELFLVVFFIFTLRQVAKELETMVTSFQELLEKRGDRKSLYMPKPISKRWLLKYIFTSNYQSTRDKGGYTHASLERYLRPDEDDQQRNTHAHEVDLERNITRTSTATQQESNTQAIPTSKMKRCKHKEWILRFRYNLWLLLKYITKYEFKFALKMAVAVTALCIPAFVPWTALWFAHDRAQWAAVTVVAIMNPTSGGTLHASMWRIIGTVIGALVGWAALETGQGSAYVLGLFAALLEDSIWKRFAAVIVGIIVSMILNSLIWPFLARHATRRSVSAIVRRLGEHYTFLVGTFLYHNPQEPPSDAEVKRSRKLEGKIQNSITATYILLELTDHEPRLKAPYPKLFYQEILNSCQNILDLLGCMRSTLLHMPAIVKKELCSEEVHADRRDMVAAIMLYFYAISSTLLTKIALPVYLPSMRAARMRLIHHRRETPDQRVKFRNMTWYAMANCSEEIVEELEHLTRLVRFILGDPTFAERAKRMEAPIHLTEIHSHHA
ncbi:hypothetical protein K492DRAFT_190575 [Lichtheimia hyalospora FSU 10163]|nr:hypothetical protein K492DRAFT_190575 [Lichtheimia hyalospora FSU 10163]